MVRDMTQLEDALQEIRMHPETWDQSQWAAVGWSCGTTHCLAGKIAVQAGALVTGWIPDTHPRHQLVASTVFTPKADLSQAMAIREFARLQCGLSHAEAGALFHGRNTLPMLEAMVKDLANDGQLRGWGWYANMKGGCCAAADHECTLSCLQPGDDGY